LSRARLKSSVNHNDLSWQFDLRTRNEFLINPFGLNYAEITASNLLKVDLDGNVVLLSPSGFGFNSAGFVIHSAIHVARHDLTCVAHTHTPAGVAVAGRNGVVA
jgi:ribulose-5-phosphate 4-epimerase/fuculose-1-phosphate aldolase